MDMTQQLNNNRSLSKRRGELEGKQPVDTPNISIFCLRKLQDFERKHKYSKYVNEQWPFRYNSLYESLSPLDGELSLLWSRTEGGGSVVTSLT